MQRCCGLVRSWQRALPRRSRTGWKSLGPRRAGSQIRVPRMSISGDSFMALCGTLRLAVAFRARYPQGIASDVATKHQALAPPLRPSLRRLRSINVYLRFTQKGWCIRKSVIWSRVSEVDRCLRRLGMRYSFKEGPGHHISGTYLGWYLQHLPRPALFFSPTPL